MAEVLDFSEYDPKNLDSNSCRIPGKCLLRVDSCKKNSGTKGDYYAINFIIEAHEDSNAVGEKYYQSFSLGGKGSKSTLKLAFGLGIVTDDMLQEAIATGDKGMSIDLEVDAYGKSCFSEIVEGEWKGKTTFKCWDFFLLNDERCEEFPRLNSTSQPAVKNDDGVEVVDDDEDEDILF